MKKAAEIVALCLLLTWSSLACQRGRSDAGPATAGSPAKAGAPDPDLGAFEIRREPALGTPKDHVRGFFRDGKDVQVRVKYSITTFAPGNRATFACLVSEANDVIHESADPMSNKGGSGQKIPDDLAAKADKIIANLPPDQPKAPDDRQVLVAVPQLLGWKVHTYDAGNLPEEILELSQLSGAGIGARILSIEPKKELDTGFSHELWGGMALSPDGKVLVANAYRSEIKAWSLPDLKPLDTFAKLPKPATVVRFSPDGKYLLADDSESLIVLDAKTGANVTTLKNGGVYGATFTPDGKYLIGYRDKLYVYRVSDWQSLPALPDLPEGVLHYSPSDNQQLAVIGCAEGKAQIWDTRTKKVVATLDTEGTLGSVRFSPDNSRVAIVTAKPNQYARQDYRIGVWDVRSGRQIRDLKPYGLESTDSPAGGLLWTPDGRYILASIGSSAVSSVEIGVWEMATGRHRASFTGPISLTGIATTPDNKTLIVGSTDEKIRFYDLEAGLKSIDAFVRSLPPLPAPNEPATFAPLGQSVPAAGKDGVLLATDWLSFSAACVSRTRLDDKPSDVPMLRVWRGTGVQEARIAGLPFSRLRIDERNLDDSIVNGKREAGGRSVETKMNDSRDIETLVVDGKKLLHYEGAYAAKLGAGGKHWAFCGIQWGFQTQFPIIDGKKGPEYDWCTGVVFSPDGDHWAFVAGQDGKAAVFKDGKPGTWRKCPRGKAVTIGARNAIGQSRLGWEGSSGAESVLWSPDSAHVAFMMQRSGSSPDANELAVFVDDTEMPVPPAVKEVGSIDKLGDWSPDSKRFAYAGWRDKQGCMVLDGEVLPQAGEVRDFVFSQDGKQFAYLVTQKDSRLSVIRDGSTLDTFYPAPSDGKTAWASDVNGIAFSPDGKHLAYVGRESKDSTWFVGIDGSRLASYEQILTKPIFDGDRLKFVVLERGEKLIKIVLVEKTFSTTAPVSPRSR